MSAPRAGTPVIVGDLEIEPIERVVVRVENVCGVVVAVALKEPVAVVLRSPRGTWRVDSRASRSRSIQQRPQALQQRRRGKRLRQKRGVRAKARRVKGVERVA